MSSCGCKTRSIIKLSTIQPAKFIQSLHYDSSLTMKILCHNNRFIPTGFSVQMVNVLVVRSIREADNPVLKSIALQLQSCWDLKHDYTFTGENLPHAFQPETNGEFQTGNIRCKNCGNVRILSPVLTWLQPTP